MADSEEELHYHRVKIRMMVRPGNHAQYLLRLPDCIVAEPGRIIHQIKRQIAKQIAEKKQNEHIPFPLTLPLFRKPEFLRETDRKRFPVRNQKTQQKQDRITDKQP